MLKIVHIFAGHCFIIVFYRVIETKDLTEERVDTPNSKGGHQKMRMSVVMISILMLVVSLRRCRKW